MDYKHWLRHTAKYYGITQKEVLLNNTRAKSTFYWLLFRDSVDLGKVSVQIGKHRTTIIKFIKNSLAKKHDKHRDRSAEEYIINHEK